MRTVCRLLLAYTLLSVVLPLLIGRGARGRSAVSVSDDASSERQNVDRDVLVYSGQGVPGASVRALEEYFAGIWELPCNETLTCRGNSKAVARAEHGKGFYTPGWFYKGYRFVSKIFPSALTVKFTGGVFE